MKKQFKPENFEILFHSGDFMTLIINLLLPESTYSQHNIHRHNIYNPPDASNSPVFDDLTSILSQKAIAANNLPYKVTIDHVIIGDFILNHLSLDCKTTQADNRAPQLLEIIN